MRPRALRTFRWDRSWEQFPPNVRTVCPQVWLCRTENWTPHVCTRPGVRSRSLPTTVARSPCVQSPDVQPGRAVLSDSTLSHSGCCVSHYSDCGCSAPPPAAGRRRACGLSALLLPASGLRTSAPGPDSRTPNVRTRAQRAHSARPHSGCLLSPCRNVWQKAQLGTERATSRSRVLSATTRPTAQMLILLSGLLRAMF